MDGISDKEALNYHADGKPGKTETRARKPIGNAHELSLAYTPGVAAPAREINKDRWKAYRYTNKGNLVAVISNGSSVLGLGNIGALASKPVMEGKAMLLKTYADIDAFDIELSDEEPDKVVSTIQALAPTFGGINLEDIKAPECFYIEERLRGLLDIPVLHDDQHGTAVTILAAVLNVCKITGKRAKELKIVISGAGAAGISTARILCKSGIEKGQITMIDSKGVINNRRIDLNSFKKEFATGRDEHSTAEAMRGADIFIGLSHGNTLHEEEIMAMNHQAAIFALANPTPEIPYKLAKHFRPDAIVATGRSDSPNQINNLIAFPYLFRGALDTFSTTINEKMEIAAAHAIAAIAEDGYHATDSSPLPFGNEYIIPHAGDKRLLTEVSSAVAKAAMESCVARREIASFKEYKATLIARCDNENFFSKEYLRHRNREHMGDNNGRIEKL